MKGPKVNVQITDDQNDPSKNGTTESEELDTHPYFSVGFNIKYIPWGLGFNVGGLVSRFYAKEIYDGLDMTTYSFTFDFDFDFGN